MSHRPARERLVGVIGAAMVVGLLGAGLIWGLAAGRLVSIDTSSPALIEVRTLPHPLTHPSIKRRSTRAAAGAPSPPNLRNRATDITPPPVVILPSPPPVTVAPLANLGMAAQSGASDRLGSGQGAGGVGNGFGGGGDGGTDQPGFKPPEQLNTLKYGYLAPELRARGAQGVAEVIFHVTEGGRVGACSIRASSGDGDLDAGICQAIQRHLLFKPSRDPSGEPVGANIIASHGWIIDRDDDGSKNL